MWNPPISCLVVTGAPSTEEKRHWLEADNSLPSGGRVYHHSAIRLHCAQKGSFTVNFLVFPLLLLNLLQPLTSDIIVQVGAQLTWRLISTSMSVFSVLTSDTWSFARSTHLLYEDGRSLRVRNLNSLLLIRRASSWGLNQQKATSQIWSVAYKLCPVDSRDIRPLLVTWRL